MGQMITFLQQETTEIRNRIRAAWATLHKYRQELTSKNYLLKHRLWLFDAVMTPTICYASGDMDTHKRARENDTVDEKKDRATKRQDLTKKKTLTTLVALVTKVKTGKAQTLTKTRTATCLSRTILKKTLILQRLKRKIESNT